MDSSLLTTLINWPPSPFMTILKIPALPFLSILTVTLAHLLTESPLAHMTLS